VQTATHAVARYGGPSTSSLERDLYLAFPLRGGSDPLLRRQLFQRLHTHYLASLCEFEAPGHVSRRNEDEAIDVKDAEIGLIENACISWEESQVDLGTLPTASEEFREWFLAITQRHIRPGFLWYLAQEATLDELAIFSLGEELIDRELHATRCMTAGNYEQMCERKLPPASRTGMFRRATRYMRTHLDRAGIDPGWRFAEAYEGAAILLMCGLHRHLNPRAFGAMAVLEQSVLPRFEAMADGCRRLRILNDVMNDGMTADIDGPPNDGWLENVLLPLVEHSPELLREISLGVATHVHVANRYDHRIWRAVRELH